MQRIAVYAGSFDPPTNGHLWMIQQGAALFDELIVAVAVNPDKPGYFSRDERMQALREMIEGLPQNVHVESVNHGFLVDFARKMGATYLLRGMRNTVDFEYEKSMARMNARMEPTLQSVFLLPPNELEEVSSSFVRGFVGVSGWERWVQACVPPCVYRLIKTHSQTRTP